MTSAWKAHVVVVGNLKGGCGKSTLAIHVALALIADGYAVACVDADVHQRSLGRFLENRRSTSIRTGRDLPTPTYAAFDRAPSALDHGLHQGARQMIERMGALHDVVVVDTAGSDTGLARTVHSAADTVITPVNDSFVDLDVLARFETGGAVEAAACDITATGVYADLVDAARQRRRQRDGSSTDWIVVRNRLSFVDARNKRAVEETLRLLATRLAFRIAPGFGERVVFRELFAQGLTVLDLGEDAGGEPLTLSQVAARHELRALIDVLRLLRPGDVPREPRALTHAV